MRRRITFIVAFSLLTSVAAAPAALAKETNHVGHWELTGYECTKDDTERGSSWVSDGAYALVVLKSSGDNDQFTGVWKGQTLETVSRKDISHIITCVDNTYDDLDGDY